jgi:hypothetical protein
MTCGVDNALLGPKPNSLPLIISLWRLEATGHEAKTSLQTAPWCEVDPALPDLEAAKSAVLNSLSCPDAQRGYRHAIQLAPFSENVSDPF